MKKFLSAICIVLCIWCMSQTSPLQVLVPSEHFSAVADPSHKLKVSAEAALLLDQESGKVLYQKNAHTKLYPASTTKILTALLALEYGDLDDIVTVGDEIQLVLPDSSKAELFSGQEICLSDLIYGLMLPSGNDAAYTISVYVAGKAKPGIDLSSKEAILIFTDLMNEKARFLGACDSHFVNPDGYHNPNHYSTASDLSLIAQAAMQYPFLRKAVAAQYYHCDTQGNGQSNSHDLHWKNTNLLLDPNSLYYDPDVAGLKTGHTKEAGHCLVAVASQNDRKFLSVILKDSEPGVWIDTSKLFDFACQQTY